MSDAVRLTDIPFSLDVPAMLKKLRIDGRPQYADRFARLVEQAVPLARPKALHAVSYVDSRAENHVVLDGVTLTSRVLSVNLDGVHRVFPFVVTCGVELDCWSRGIRDMLERFWADAIMEEALRAAFDALKDHLVRRYDLGHTAFMTPGSLEDWPIEQQAPLFSLLGDPHAQIGVQLADTFMMTPVKSVSGLHFPTEASFENCQLCPRDPCPNRRAPYDPDLYRTRYLHRGSNS
ncbi:MAG TPA: vitamin B12 dependent-methionine synthase activation domain-containing protein [Phycisphaerae bacterium]|nr:vitamin B12 dependent-methionine synthase activation domain-containing protein [Phycisphaerae bacterium]HOJ74591.1 vitamin B12 dependent-methionine synthase activation domain-containing protein [Phycisphaerae bacterium]HOM50490.1 vitamin B12 dependent-methionine synthase activation domain-containing protein [Phycisphaerae bacterium]HON66334.1 vitamin B12 dependent-methionine synthase activation domain-containing protein [Phycisphaerae bacterium]HOQ87044.1 vitamin B12 dependent-methionine syn